MVLLLGRHELAKHFRAVLVPVVELRNQTVFRTLRGRVLCNGTPEARVTPLFGHRRHALKPDVVFCDKEVAGLERV